MAEQKGGQVTDKKKLMFDDANGDVKKLHKSGDHGSQLYGLFSLDDDLSVFEFDVHGNEGFPIVFQRLDHDDDDDDQDDDDDDDFDEHYICICVEDPGILGEHTNGTDRLEYFLTSPFDVNYEDESLPRVASNNDSGGGYGGVSTSNNLEEMLILMASTDHFVPMDMTVANNASGGEATDQSLEQERDRVSVGDSENSTDSEKGGEEEGGVGGGRGGFLLGWWQKLLLLLGLWKTV